VATRSRGTVYAEDVVKATLDEHGEPVELEAHACTGIDAELGGRGAEGFRRRGGHLFEHPIAGTQDIGCRIIRRRCELVAKIVEPQPANEIELRGIRWREGVDRVQIARDDPALEGIAEVVMLVAQLMPRGIEAEAERHDG